MHPSVYFIRVITQLTMKPLQKLLLIKLLFTILTYISAQPYKTLVAPIIKHPRTSLFSITLNFHDRYVIDLNSPFLWFICDESHKPVDCNSPACIEGRSYLSPLCLPANNPYENGQCYCKVTPVNPITKSCSVSELTYKDLIIFWTDGRNPTVGINFNQLYVSCAPTSLLRSLPKGVSGMAGLSTSLISLSSQFTTHPLDIATKFAICLPNAPHANGVIFFGDGPYNILPPTNLDASTLVSYTPLVKNGKSGDYYIGVNGISINGEGISVSAEDLALDPLGHGGVKLSTVIPYTTLRSDIYKRFLKSFSKATKDIPRLNPIKPFDLCLNATSVGFTRVGLRVPQIDLQLSNGKNWTIFGVNSMKHFQNDVACLAFVEGSDVADEAVVIGSFQMEDNFLIFDLAESQLGFSSSLLFERVTCSNFNFTVLS